MTDNISDNKLNIAQFVDTFYPNIDGVVSVTNHYAQRLNISDRCTVFAPKRKNYIDNLPYEVIRCKGFIVPFLKMDCALPNNDIHLKHILKERDFDIYHAHSPFSLGRYACSMARKLDVPIVTTFHTKYFEDFKKILKVKSLAKSALKNIINFYESVDEVWTVNNNMVETLKEYGYSKNAQVMLNGTEYNYPANKDYLIDNINQIYKLDKDELVFTFVGQMIFQKNIKLTIDSVKLLRDKNIKFKLFMVGTGYNEKFIKEYTTELGLDNYVIYTGRIADRNILSGIYLRSKLLMFPSLYDASSIVLIEAAAHKLPGVLINNATTAEKIIDNRNGFLAENTPESFAGRIYELLKDDALITTAGENAFKEIYINWDNIINCAKDRYKLVIDRYKKEHETAVFKKRNEWT